MKIIYFFLLSLIISDTFSQNKEKDDSYIIFSRVYNEPDDGPCNLFIHKETSSFGISTKKIKCSSSLIEEFKKLKKKSFKWKKTDDICHKGWIGHTTIENQIILKSNTYLDTIYFNINEYHKLIINYNGDSYQDNNDDIYKSLCKNKEVKAFFDAPLKKYNDIVQEFDFNLINDSISIDKFKINGKNLYGFNEKLLSEVIGGFHSSTIYSEIYNDWKIERSFERNNSKYFFYDSDNIKKIELTFGKSKLEDESIFFEFEIEVNDKLIQPYEKDIVEIFPRYREYLNLKREYFNDQDGTYTMRINFINNKGNFEFIFENMKLISIVINYNY
jgi:hypothetical protein